MSIRDFAWNGTSFENIDADTLDSRDSTYFSPTTHTHSNYSLTSHTHTAAQVGALATTGGTINGALTVTGNLTAARVYNAVWNDIAELFESDTPEELKPGDLLSWSGTGVVKAKECNKKLLVGVYSDTYGYLLGGEEGLSEEENLKHFVPVGLAGRIYVNVKGKVSAGDLITVSDEDGIGQKCENYIPGTVVGKALEEKNEEHTRRIEMLICNM